MSTLLMHNIEPFFCSAQNTTHTNDEDHLSFQNVTNVGFPETLASFTIDTSMNNSGNSGHSDDQSPLSYHHNLYQNGINGNYHQLLTHNNANNNHHYHLVVDGNNHQLLDNQLLHNYSTNACFSTANNNNNDMKSEFLLDEYNNNTHTHINNNHEQTVGCIPCILDDYPAQIENSSTPSSPQSWSIKSPEQWLASEVAQWIRYWAQRNEIQDIEVAHLLYNRMSGLELCQMQREYFTTVCPQYGDLIYDSLQALLQQFRCSSSSQIQHPTINSNNSPTTSISAPATCYTLSPPSVATSANQFPDNNSNNNNAVQMNHCIQENCGRRESDSSTNNENLLTSNEQHHPHHHHLLPMIDIYCNNNNVDLLSTVSAVANIFDGSSPPPPQTPTITHHATHTHQYLQQHSPSYSNAFDSDDRESTSSTYSSNDLQHQKISLNSTTYYSSPQSTTSSILNNNNHLHQHFNHHHDDIHVPFNDNNDNLSAMKQHRSDNNINANNLNSNGRRGRPPKKENKSRSKGNGKLWEFIRDLLLNPITNPSLIRWERREDGIFKFIQSDKVAKMWGERKQNPRMTYEKLSRAMRYYYKSQVLLPVFGRRLVYKFGPNATGWRPTPLTASSIHHHTDNNNDKIDFSTTTIIEINQN